MAETKDAAEAGDGGAEKDIPEQLQENVVANIDQATEQVSAWVDTLIEFAVTYGFQILGALVFLFIGLKIASWVGKRIQILSEKRDIDETLAKFLGNITKIIVIAFVGVITLGNFGITIAPLIALAGASAFGATLAIQGPLSNYGAGLSIILARPFKVGNTISVQETAGTVQEVKLAHTVLTGEDGERITVPNKEIVGQVIVNSDTRRVVQTKVSLAPEADVPKAIKAVEKAVSGFKELTEGKAPQVGLHDFTYGGLVLGVRFWVPSARYYELRYAVNNAVFEALKRAKVPLLTGIQPAVLAESFSGDGMREGKTDEPV